MFGRKLCSWMNNFTLYILLFLIFWSGLELLFLVNLHWTTKKSEIIVSDTRKTLKNSGIKRIRQYLDFSKNNNVNNKLGKGLLLKKLKFLEPPSDLPYQLKEDPPVDIEYMKYKSYSPSWVFIDSVLSDLFNTSRKSSSFFVEAGALDGEYLSNTLSLEKKKNWSGLLVDADQTSYKEMLQKHRKSWTSPCCLATKSHPYEEVITSYTNGKASSWSSRGATRILQKLDVYSLLGPGFPTFNTILCVPLVDLLDALEVTYIDFFSLDVEGLEMNILNNFPFDRITVDVWAIEHTFPNSSSKSELEYPYEDKEFLQFMEHRGYYLFDMFCQIIPDYIFVRKDSDIFPQLQVPDHLQQRRNICVKKKQWNPETMSGLPKDLRDKTHWPHLKYKILD